MQPNPLISRLAYIIYPHSMKKYFSVLLCLLVLSSCSIYSVNKGTLKTPRKDVHQVVYQVDLGEGLTTRINYTDANGKKVKIKSVTGKWEQSVSLPSGSAVNLKVVANGKDLSTDPKIKGRYASAKFKIKVDDEVVSEYVLSNKKIKYNVSFVLP